MNRLIVRPETPGDGPAIADLHTRAFTNRVAEAVIVALHRQRAAFDPELSLVAERDGQIVGHALFSPRTIYLFGKPVAAVNLAPIGVDPACQRTGIGSALMEEGHRIAVAKGYSMSFLLGHASYYPRFGYRTHAYARWESVIETDTAALDALEERRPMLEDLPALIELWERSEAAVDFAMRPAAALIEWVSPNPRIISSVYVHEGDLVGFTRIDRDEPTQPRYFLARDGVAARHMAAILARHSGPDTREIVAPVHPAAASADALRSSTPHTSQATMAVPLTPGPLDDYLQQTEHGDRPRGSVIWPVEFDL